MPLDTKDERVVKEMERQEQLGFPACRCSNCEPDDSRILERNLSKLKRSNFEQGIHDPSSLDPDGDYTDEGWEVYEAEKAPPPVTRKRKTTHLTSETEDGDLLDLLYELSEAFSAHLIKTYGGDPPFLASDLYNETHSDAILDQLECISSLKELRKVVGGETIPGTLPILLQVITSWKSQYRDQAYYERLRERRERVALENIEVLKRLEEQEKLKQSGLAEEQRIAAEKADEKAAALREKQLTVYAKWKQDKKMAKDMIILQWIKAGCYDHALLDQKWATYET